MHLGTGVQRIGEKDQIEFGAFRGLRDALDQREVFRPRFGIFEPPAGDMMAGAKG